jgi:hypothetical protein
MKCARMICRDGVCETCEKVVVKVLWRRGAHDVHDEPYPVAHALLLLVFLRYDIDAEVSEWIHFFQLRRSVRNESYCRFWAVVFGTETCVRGVASMSACDVPVGVAA